MKEAWFQFPAYWNSKWLNSWSSFVDLIQRTLTWVPPRMQHWTLQKQIIQSCYKLQPLITHFLDFKKVVERSAHLLFYFIFNIFKPQTILWVAFEIIICFSLKYFPSDEFLGRINLVMWETTSKVCFCFCAVEG